jgi:RNA polymerase sigma-70 factor (ECF subfamily)
MHDGSPKTPVVPEALTEADVKGLEPVLRVVALRTVGDPTVAEDLVQETLLAAIVGLATFDGRCALRTWIVGILSHKAVDYFRRGRRWDPIEDQDESDPRLVSGWTRSPEAAMSDRQALDVLEVALKALPDKERLAVVLCDVEDLDREEVCNVLGVRATHLRVLLHRARHRLRKALQDAGV